MPVKIFVVLILGKFMKTSERMQFRKDCKCDPHQAKRTLWELRKVSTLVSLHSPHRLTTVETFRYWQIFYVLSDNST